MAQQSTRSGKKNTKAKSKSKGKSKSSGRRRSSSGNSSNGTRASRQQAARQARKKVDERRSKADGVAGWVAERAGAWSLDDWDPSWMDRQKYFWNPLVDYWFRMEVEGWENIPEPPVLLIGIHSGAPFVWDAWTVGLHWWRRFGENRPLHGTAHDALMSAPLIGDYFRKMGVLPAAPDSISGALAAGRDVALWPGGEVDSLRAWKDRDKAVLAGRTGFVKMAIKSKVPIVPIATMGGPDSMPVLATGRRLAKVLQLDKVARLKMFPIALSVPWGVGPALLPEIPLPTKIRTAFQPPVELKRDPKLADDDDYVEAKYDEVRDSIQHGVDALTRRRRLPLFG
jgi:1-acyl-sn-glycerol-3-phosphate acyltransferase